MLLFERQVQGWILSLPQHPDSDKQMEQKVEETVNWCQRMMGLTPSPSAAADRPRFRSGDKTRGKHEQ
jgi:hypothetical protein